MSSFQRRAAVLKASSPVVVAVVDDLQIGRRTSAEENVCKSRPVYRVRDPKTRYRRSGKLRRDYAICSDTLWFGALHKLCFHTRLRFIQTSASRHSMRLEYLSMNFTPTVINCPHVEAHPLGVLSSISTLEIVRTLLCVSTES
jgi:hypothetical protein